MATHHSLYHYHDTVVARGGAWQTDSLDFLYNLLRMGDLRWGAPQLRPARYGYARSLKSDKVHDAFKIEIKGYYE